LSGERPFKIIGRLPDEAAQIILTQEPLKPSSVASERRRTVNNETNGGQKLRTKGERDLTSVSNNSQSLKGDLDNIILKALRKEPERRYASVQEFSEDIRRHLAGLPVTATADSTGYRLKKFVRRHRAGVFAGGLIALSLLAATAVTSWQAIVAKRERDRAEQRFNQVRKIANTILFDYHERIKEMPGATGVREKMVADSLEYLDNLANESDYSADLQRELTAAYKKIGGIQGDLSGGGNLGKTQAALESFQKALAIQETLVAAYPENTEDRRMLASLLIDVAQQYENTGDLQSEESYARKAIDIFRNVADELPNETKPRSDMARALWTLASAVRAKGDLDGAVTSYRQAADIYESLAEQKPEERKFIRNAALTYKNIGGVLELKKDYLSAMELYQKALPIDVKNAADEPDNTTSQMDLSFTLGSLAAALLNLGDYNAALENARKKLAIQLKVADADAKNAFAQASLARTYRQFGTIFTKLERHDEASTNFQKSITIMETLLAADPNSVKRKIDLAESYSIFGDFLSDWPRNAVSNIAKLTRLREAQIFQKRCTDILDGLSSQNTLDKRGEEILVSTLKNWQKTGDEIAKLSVK
ncbi:MAG: hypothetical protein H7070_11515, partial [Saprospiraceae bacterium]|nr:hypothetical protein [Pyrinomonadaceae bacterium]